MKEIIQALQIFLKYGNPHSPFHCEHDTLYVMIEPQIVSVEDKAALRELGFIAASDNFVSHRFGSA